MPGFSDTFCGAVCAADIDALNRYLKAGADVKSVDNSGNTVLHNIAWISEPNPNGRYADAVRLLVEAGADINARKARGGATPLHIAVRCSRAVGSELVEGLLDSGADPNLENDNGATPLHDCVSSWSGGEDPQDDACTVDMARLLLDAGADSTRWVCGHTPLHSAAGGGNPEAVNLLISSGADANARDAHGGTPLHWAVRIGNEKAVELLLASGASANAANAFGNTPLHIAGQVVLPRSADPYLRTIALLTEHGAVATANSWNALPAEFATDTKLQERLRELEDPNHRSRRPYETEIVIRFGTDHLDWTHLCELFSRASEPFDNPSFGADREPDKLRRAAENSQCVCSAFDGTLLVGFARVISDAEYHGYICDVVVLPNYKNDAVLKGMCDGLASRLPGQRVACEQSVGPEDVLHGMLQKTGSLVFR